MTTTRKMDLVIASIREEVVAGVSRILLALGGLALLIGIVREAMRGAFTWESYGFPMLVFCAFLGMHTLRTRISVKVRGGMMVGGFLSVGLHSILNYGLLAPAILLVPTSLLLSWMVFGSARFGWLVGGVLASLLLTVDRVVRYGPLMPPISVDYANSQALFWINYAMIQILAGAMILETLRRVVGCLVQRESVASERRDHYRGLFDGLQDAIFIHSATDGEVLDRNWSAHAMFGPGHVDRTANAGSRFPWSVEDPRGTFLDAVSKGTHRKICRSRRLEGREIWTDVALRTFSVAGEPHVLAMVRDVDDSFRRRRELEALNRGLDTVVAERTSESEAVRLELRRRGDELSIELVDRLNSIESMAGSLEDRWTSEGDRERLSHLRRILSGARRMDALISSFRGLSRIDRIASNPTTVDMAALARECCQEFFAGTGAGSGVEWFVEPLSECMTDPVLVRQVVANLLSNAFKSVKGRPDGRIRIVDETRADGVWYGVQDNGAGFDPSSLENMFDVYRSVGEESGKGVGIGLATVQRILRQLGGGIEVRGGNGQGAEFWFLPGALDLPAGRRSESETESVEAQGRGGTP